MKRKMDFFGIFFLSEKTISKAKRYNIKIPNKILFCLEFFNAQYINFKKNGQTFVNYGTDHFLKNYYKSFYIPPLGVRGRFYLLFNASAPPTISKISFVIAAWRVRLYTKISSFTNASAFSVALSIADIRAPCSEALDSKTAL